jgi:hypothetical protein
VEREAEEAAALAQERVNMSWISQEMMRDRTSGPFENYGEMLYAESIEGLARKRERVSRVACSLGVQGEGRSVVGGGRAGVLGVVW